MCRSLAVVFLAVTLGFALSLAVNGGVPAARASLPCGLLRRCATTTTAAPAPTTTTATVAIASAPTLRSQVVQAGRRYKGRSAGARWGITLGVAKSGTAVTDYGIDFSQGRCSNHSTYYGFASQGRAVRISASGVVDQLVSTHRAAFYNRAGRKLTGTERFKVHIQFHHHSRLTGTLMDTFTRRGLICRSGTVSFSARAQP